MVGLISLFSWDLQALQEKKKNSGGLGASSATVPILQLIFTCETPKDAWVWFAKFSKICLQKNDSFFPLFLWTGHPQREGSKSPVPGGPSAPRTCSMKPGAQLLSEATPRRSPLRGWANGGKGEVQILQQWENLRNLRKCLEKAGEDRVRCRRF